MMMGASSLPCRTNQLSVSATSLMPLARPSGGDHVRPVDDHVDDAHDRVPNGVPCAFERGDRAVFLQFGVEALEPADEPFDACLDDGHGVGDAVGDPAHAAGDGGFGGVEHARAELDERGFEVAGGSLDGAGAGGGFHGGVGEAQGHDRVVEFLCGDLPVGHGVAEVAGVGSGFLERLLDFAACAGDRVRELVPVLGREFSLAGGLGQYHRHAFEGVGRSAGDGVEVACGFGEPVVVGHAVGGELRGGVADVVEVVDGLVGVVLRAGGESFDLPLADAGEVQCAGELLGAVGGAGDFAGQAHERFDGLARDALRDAGDDAEFRAEAAGEAVAGFDAGGGASGFRCAAERRFDGLADALHAGHDLHERGGDLDCHVMPP